MVGINKVRLLRLCDAINMMRGFMAPNMGQRNERHLFSYTCTSFIKSCSYVYLERALSLLLVFEIF